MAITKEVKEGENPERALRTLKKTLMREGVILEARRRRYFKKKSRQNYEEKRERDFLNSVRVRREKGQ